MKKVRCRIQPKVESLGFTSGVRDLTSANEKKWWDWAVDYCLVKWEWVRSCWYWEGPLYQEFPWFFRLAYCDHLDALAGLPPSRWASIKLNGVLRRKELSLQDLKNKVTPLLAAPWIPCNFLNAFFSFCEPLQYVVGFVILVHIKILCIFQYFYLILWNFHCVFKFQVTKPLRQAVFLGRVQRFDFTGSCVICTTVLTKQESYPCLFLCCASTQNFASTV